MVEEIRKIKGSKKELKYFGITIGIVLQILSLFFLFYNIGSWYALIFIGLIFVFCGLFIPKFLSIFYWPWMFFSIIIGWIMTRIILTILFYIIVSPIGLIFKIFGKKFLELKWDNEQESYWNIRENKILEKQNYRNQY